MVSNSWIYASLISEKNHVSCSFGLHFSFEKNKHPLMFLRHLHFHFYKLFTFFAHLGGTQKITIVSDLPGLCLFWEYQADDFQRFILFLTENHFRDHKFFTWIFRTIFFLPRRIFSQASCQLFLFTLAPLAGIASCPFQLDVALLSNGGGLNPTMKQTL